MKKFIMSIMIITLLMCNTFAGGAIVFDPTNYLVAIDTLYSTYDQIMTSIEQLKTTYEQAQRYYEEVQSWKFDNIRWDGDWDFRNEIKQATRSIDRQVSNIRNLENTLTKRKISLGGYSYTVADLVGAGEKDKNLIAALDNTYSWMTKTQVEKAMSGFAGKLTEREKMAIWRKYGLSPVNYLYLGEKKKVVDEIVAKITAFGMKEAAEENIKINQEKMNNVVSAAFGDDNTEKALLQQLILANQILSEQLTDMNNNIATAGAATAQQLVYTQQQKDIEKEEAAIQAQKREEDKKPDAFFLFGLD